ncbi:MAG: adenosyl-hopene transferase HpnH, partial [Pirellulales bacterium]
RDGVYEMAVNAIRAARNAGFRVTTNSTLFADAEPERCRQFFDEVMQLGVEGMMVSPGYSYEKAPEQDIFLSRERSHGLFRKIFKGGTGRWKFNQSPVFLEFLKGNWDLECRPWGTPSYSLFGWQKPCYLLDEGYAESFTDLMNSTDWNSYGRASGNPKCQQCMAHCGYEPAAVEATFGSWKGFLRTARLAVFGPPRDQDESAPSLPEKRQAAALPMLPIIDSIPAKTVA